MRPYDKAKDEGGSRIGIVLNGSPLFTGGAGSGESEIRRWVIENDWLEAIVALPTDMFYNTGIATYVWMLTNKKSDARKGKVQLINGAEYYRKMRKSLGSKRKELGQDDIERLVGLHGRFEELRHVKVIDAQGNVISDEIAPTTQTLTNGIIHRLRLCTGLSSSSNLTSSSAVSSRFRPWGAGGFRTKAQGLSIGSPHSFRACVMMPERMVSSRMIVPADTVLSRSSR